MAAIVAQLETITKANGYFSQVGQSVHEWRPLQEDGSHLPFDESELPAVIIRDTAERKEYETQDAIIREVQLMLEIVCKEGTTTPAKVREMIDDVEKCLRSGGDYGGEIIQITLGDNEMVVHQRKKIIGGALIEAVAQYKTYTI